MSLIFNIEKGVAHGVVMGALTPFVTAGDTTEAKAAEMADAVVDAFQLFHDQAGKPAVDLAHAAAESLRAAVYAALQPFVVNGSTDAAKASQISWAITDALAMFSAAAKSPPK